ncbi:MAG: AAA family ATPase [Verrucomicrobiota bacterium]|nr:AAA family ATPase [Verrucomicrobiota bacterium]
MLKKYKKYLPALLVAISLAAGVRLLPTPELGPEEISRTRLQLLQQEKAFINAEVSPRGFENIYMVKGSYQRPSRKNKVDFTITTHLTEAELQGILATPGTTLSMPKSSTRGRVLDMLPSITIALLVIGLLLYQQNTGKGKATHRIRLRPNVRFNDIAGVEEAKAEVQEVIDFLRNPGKYQQLGGNLPKGILLIGPPGTGKTMLAKAIAGEANASFFSASGSDFNEIYVGVGAKRIRELFNQARKAAPAIIFIDEIDCLGKNRKNDHSGELQQTNNALLTAMDGFDSSEGIIVVAATNRPEDLDEALLRPGRFDRKVFVPLPDMVGRRAILKTHGRKAPITTPELTLDIIARTTPGMSGADLANVINEAAILSAQRSMTEISLKELEEARDKVRWGKERKSMTLKEDERRVIAYHEAGHAIISLNKTKLPPLHKVSIIPRGNALGSCTTLPNEDQNIHSRTFLLQQLTLLMGGRAAENLFIGDMTNGANGDFDSAKNIARKMVHDWGMGQKLFYEPNKEDAEREINLLLSNAHKEAHEILLQNKESVVKIAEKLLIEETLTREQVLQYIEQEDAQNQACTPPDVNLPRQSARAV